MEILGQGRAAHPLIAVVGYGVSDFVTYDGSQLVVVVDEVGKSFIYNDISAGQAEGVDLLRLDEVDVPVQTLHRIVQPCSYEIIVHRVEQLAADNPHLLGHSSIGRSLCRLGELFVGLLAQSHYVAVGIKKHLLASSKGHTAARIDYRHQDD